MSIVSDARTYADTAIEQGKTTFTFAQGRLLALTGDARERATSVADDTKGLAAGAVDLARRQAYAARRQAYAAIGATDALVASISKRTEELPGESKRTATKLVDTTKARITSAQDKVLAVAGDLKGRGEDVVGSARKIDLSATTTGAKDEVESRVDQVKTVFAKLADRGEKVAADLRNDPHVTRVVADADKAVEKAANEVTSVAQKVRYRAASKTPTVTVTAPATQAPVKRAYVRKATATVSTPAAKTTATVSTPAKKAPAKRTAAKKAPAKRAYTKRTSATKVAAAK